MPIPCQGFTFTWGGATLSEVQELEVNLQRDLPLGRSTTWTPNLGEVRLLSLSIGNLPTSEYGRRKRLVINAPAATIRRTNTAWPHNGTTTTSTPAATLCDVDCIYKGVTINGTANGVVKFAHAFMVMDTVGAPTNP